MKVLITALGLAVVAYACQEKFVSAQKISEKDRGSMQTFFSSKKNLPVTGSINVEMKGNTTAGEMIPNNVQKQSEGYDSLRAEDFFFVSLIMVN